ncbi:hypothetical protein ABZ923_00285 [Streptomyces sp. NPDC046881]|uniref:hypothetical protein n=1 Tax=Streptomyces sp. NPDC046881 TaxID=3155374 RepID=UPI0033DED378
MSKTPDFFVDLRRVGALKRERLGGRPSDAALSNALRPPVSGDPIGRVVAGGQISAAAQVTMASWLPIAIWRTSV